MAYEKQDINVFRVIGIAVATIAVLVVIVIFLSDYFTAEKEDLVYDVLLKPPSKELLEIHAREQETLTTYKLLDAGKGVYQIPIEHAMKLLAGENTPR